MKKLAFIGLTVATVSVLAVLARPYRAMAGKKTAQDRVAEFGEAVEKRVAADFSRVGVAYPPETIALLGFKQERRLEVYAGGHDGRNRWVRSYPILAASGTLGPKLREGDRQVPEGLYRISFLNPNSLYHLSLRVNYPNEFDRARAGKDGRTNLGGDIMIHGRRAPIGCLAMGDEAAEGLFVLAALTGIENVRVVLSPVDFRKTRVHALPKLAPQWTSELYVTIQKELMKFTS